jgi:hypothetical protein
VTTGTPVVVREGVSTDTTTGVAHFAIAPDSTLTYVPGGSSTIDRQIVWADGKGATTPIALPPGLYNDLRISPDGSRIAVLVGSSGSGDISIYDTHSTAFSRFTFDQTNATPIWSSDSKSLYYVSIKATGDKTTVLKRPIDGSREAVSLGTVPSRAYLDAVDATEKTAYLSSYEPQSAANVDVLALSLVDGTSTPMVAGRNNQNSSAVSPDGRWLAYQSDEGGHPEIYVRDLKGAGGRSQVSTAGGEEPHWSADGRQIFYRNDTQFMVASVVPGPEFRSNPPMLVFEGIYNLRSDTGVSYDIDRTTGRFAMLRQVGQLAGAPAARVRVLMNWIDQLQKGGSAR